MGFCTSSDFLEATAMLQASTEANAVSWSATTISISDTEANDTPVHVQDTPVQRVTAKAHGSQNPTTPLSLPNSTSGPSQSCFWRFRFRPE